MDYKRNDHSDFVGLEALKTKQLSQLALFEEWAKNKNWEQFHSSHYDWWMFPYGMPSQFGLAYVVYESEIVALKSDTTFIQNYLRGVELLLLSWGWHLKTEEFVANKDSHQEWNNWPIRLYKCAKSLQEFGCDKEFNSVRKYANYLIKEGKSFAYNGRDLSEIFR